MSGRTNEDWCAQLAGATPDAALTELRDILLRGLRFALISYRVTDADLEDFVQNGLLRILHEHASYRGEARFTSWAHKVCVRVALTELRRRRWRDVSLDDLVTTGEASDFTPVVLTDRRFDPGRTAPAHMMLATLQRIIAEELTERQRTAITAIMQGGMPMPRDGRAYGDQSQCPLQASARCPPAAAATDDEPLAGKNAAEAMPLVQDHLNRCMDCREEFHALLLALQSTTFSPRPDSYPG